MNKTIRIKIAPSIIDYKKFSTLLKELKRFGEFGENEDGCYTYDSDNENLIKEIFEKYFG